MQLRLVDLPPAPLKLRFRHHLLALKIKVIYCMILLKTILNDKPTEDPFIDLLEHLVVQI